MKNYDKIYNEKVLNFILSPKFEDLNILIGLCGIVKIYESVFNTEIKGDFSQDLSWFKSLSNKIQESLIKILNAEIVPFLDTVDDDTKNHFKNFMADLKVVYIEKMIMIKELKK